jgi:hypothetical protein
VSRKLSTSVCYLVFKDQLLLRCHLVQRRATLSKPTVSVKGLFHFFPTAAETYSSARRGLFGNRDLQVKCSTKQLRQTKGPSRGRGPLSNKFRRRPTFPHSLPCSIIGAVGLNFCVRNGNRCDSYAIATENRKLVFNCLRLFRCRFPVRGSRS